MQYYANLCAPYAEKNATLTIDLPAEDMDQFMELVHILKEEKNLSGSTCLYRYGKVYL